MAVARSGSEHKINRMVWALALLLPLAVGCAPAQEPIGPVFMQRGPSDLDFQRAMESAGSNDALANVETCRSVRSAQCVPLAGGKRFECRYRYERGREGKAVLEREAHGFWRWVSGPRHCTASEPD